MALPKPNYRPLEGRLAIITGSSRGIGAGIAEKLASKGASIVLNYTSDDSSLLATTLARELESKHSIICLPIKSDISTPTGPIHLISTVKHHFTDPQTSQFQIDILINNAGIAKSGILGEITTEDFNSIFAVNVLGAIMVTQATFPYLLRDRSGRITNISSMTASCDFIGQSIYGASEGTLEALTRTWARELAERAMVNAVNIGPVATGDFYSVPDVYLEGYLRPWMQVTPLARAMVGVDDERVLRGAEVMGGRAAYII